MINIALVQQISFFVSVIRLSSYDLSLEVHILPAQYSLVVKPWFSFQFALGDVRTFAGVSGKKGFRDGKTTEAQFYHPTEIAIDMIGQYMFIADLVRVFQLFSDFAVSQYSILWAEICSNSRKRVGYVCVCVCGVLWCPMFVYVCVCYPWKWYCLSVPYQRKTRKTPVFFSV